MSQTGRLKRKKVAVTPAENEGEWATLFFFSNIAQHCNPDKVQLSLFLSAPEWDKLHGHYRTSANPPPKHSAWLAIVLLASKLSYTHQWRMLTICIYISERRDKFLNEINLTVIIVTLHPPQNQNTAHDWLSYTSRPSYRTRANGDGNWIKYVFTRWQRVRWLGRCGHSSAETRLREHGPLASGNERSAGDGRRDRLRIGRTERMM